MLAHSAPPVTPAFHDRNGANPDDQALLPAVVAAVQAAGRHMHSRFAPDLRPRPASRNGIVAALCENDAASLGILREALTRACPRAGWVEDELEGGALPPGEWWVVDAVEGNINHVQGMAEWGVTATLVRDNRPVLTAVDLPTASHTYTAVRGSGAWRNGARLRPSTKTELGAALVGTGQAKPGEDRETHCRIGQSVTAMLGSALTVRVSVPATFPLINVAAGRMDVFWQHSQVRSGLLAGALLVAEAGGTVSDIHGRPWGLASINFLAATPGLHAAAVELLSAVA